MVRPDEQSEAPPRLHGGWLRIVCLLWLLVVFFDLALWLAGLPTLYQRTLTGTFLSDPAVRQNLQNAGLSADTYAMLGVLFQ